MTRVTKHGSKHHYWSFGATFVLQTFLYLGSFLVKTVGVLILHLELWMIGEDDQGDPTWFQTSLLVIWSNFCFTNILVCWLFLGQDWRGPYAPFGVVDDRSRWPGDPIWFQTSLLVIWSNFCFTNILISWLFLGQDWRGPYAPFGVVNDRRGWPG